MDGTFISRIAKDQVSMGHPFAAYTITPMAEAAGIYHTRPGIVFVPKQNALNNLMMSMATNCIYLNSDPMRTRKTLITSATPKM